MEFQDMNKNFDIKRIKRNSGFKMQESHSHPFHELFYLESGECTAFIDHNIYTFSKGDFVIVPAGTIHRTDYTGEGVHQRIVISFKTSFTDWISNIVGEDIVASCMETGVVRIPEKRRDYIESIMEKLLFENEGQDPLSPGFINVALVELILFIVRCKRYESNIIKEIDVNNQIMQEIATYIYNHYNEKLVLEDMARQFNLSRSYLSKKFKSSTGFGFKEYIINVRIQHACTLLLETSKSITDIAFECGFNDSNYFGDAFRRIKGISPNKYRKNKENV
ncbi:MAG: helix-turn-helix domain-containing protein [Lachnospira sp.]